MVLMLILMITHREPSPLHWTNGALIVKPISFHWDHKGGMLTAPYPSAYRRINVIQYFDIDLLHVARCGLLEQRDIC